VILPSGDGGEGGSVSREAKEPHCRDIGGKNTGAHIQHAQVGEGQKEREREKSLKMHDGSFFIRGLITAAPHLGSTYRARI